MFSTDVIPEQARELLRGNYKQVLRMEMVTTVDNVEKTIEISDNDILQGSFKWDRYFTTGNMLEVGTAIAAEIEFTLLNKGYLYDQGGNKIDIDKIRFEGKELEVYLGIKKWNARRWENAQFYEWKIGNFTITTMPHKADTIFISALDRMTWFDLYVPSESNPFQDTETLQSIVGKICTVTNTQYDSTGFIELPNYDLQVNMGALLSENNNITYRSLIQWVAALTGTCALFSVDENDNPILIFRWLEEVEETIVPHDRYNSDVYEPVQFTGLEVRKDNDVEIYSGVEAGQPDYYHYIINNNSLIQGDDWKTAYNEAFNNIWNELSFTAIQYCPCSASIVPLIYLEPMDIVDYQDNDGSTHKTIISKITFTLNGDVSIESVGKSDTEAKVVTQNSTPAQQSNDKYLKEQIRNLQNSEQAARDRLTDIVKQALGLRRITVTDGDSTYYYFTTANIPDGSTSLDVLAEKGKLQPNDVIYSFSGAGVVWCSGSDWDKDAGEPYTDWQYGIAKDGTAVLGLINTEGINVSSLNTIYQTIIEPQSFSVYQGDNLVFAFNGALESQINRLLVKSNIDDPTSENNAYIKLGNAMLVPADDGMNIVYMEDE